MKIVVIGGSGRIGRKLVRKLRRDHCHVRAASPTLGVDAFTGAGLAKALVNADVVVDCSNSPSIEGTAPAHFFETAGRNLVAAEKRAGVRAHVVLSIVGLERLLAGPYFRAKEIQEDIVGNSGIGFTIVRSTQFFEFISGVVQEGGASEIPISPALVQPIAGREVARFLAEAALAEPLNATVDVAGPEQLHLDELATEIATLYEDGRTVVADVHAPYFGTELHKDSLLPGLEARLGRIRFDDWLRSTLRPTMAGRRRPSATPGIQLARQVARTTG
jgi:uncharacterized protein YbjT (DUF2867 family)